MVKFQELTDNEQFIAVVLFGLLMIACGAYIGYRLGVNISTTYYEELFKDKCVYIANQLF